MNRQSIDRRMATSLGIAGSILAAGWSWLNPAPVLAQGAPAASPWSSQKYGPMRLVAGIPSGPASAGKLYAGVHIKLDPGWKTYWRQPGDSGVPPQLDWTGSVNLAEARVLYPVPIRLQEGGLTMLGYKGEVVLPVEITPKEPGKPVELSLAAEYGVCKDICIPAEAKLSLLLPPNAALGATLGEGALIAKFLTRVPMRVGDGLPTLSNIKEDLGGPAPRLTLEAMFPRGSEGADALIEVIGGELAPLPVITERKGDLVRFEAKFSSADAAKNFVGKPLLVTLVSAAAQAEVPAQLP